MKIVPFCSICKNVRDKYGDVLIHLKKCLLGWAGRVYSCMKKGKRFILNCTMFIEYLYGY